MSFNDEEILKSEKLTYFVLVPIIILYSLFLTIFAQSGFPQFDSTYFFMPYVSDKIIGEDGYYMLTVAWNLAQGYGISYNFGEETTGIQPLATFVYAVIAKVVQIFEYDKFVFARWTFFFNTILFVYFSHLMGKLSSIILKDTNERVIYLVAFSMSLFNLVLFKHFTYGLETGLYLILFSLTIIHALTRPIDKLKNITVFGILVGLTGLARIDFGIIFFIFFLFVVMSDKKKFSPLIYVGIIALLIVSPWFLYIYKITGQWIPSSGGAQASLVSSSDVLINRAFIMINSIGDNAIPFLYGGRVFISLFEVLISLICIYLINKFSVFSCIKEDYKYWLYGTGIIILIYITTFWAHHFYTRYSSPIVLFTIPILSVLIVKITQNITHINRFILFCIGMFFVFSTLVYHRGAVDNLHSISTGYILDRYPNKVIGAFQSGVLGYYNTNTYNLDGKLDSESLQFLKEGKIDQIISQKKIDVIIDWEMYIRKINTEYLKDNFVLVDSLSNKSQVYIRK